LALGVNSKDRAAWTAAFLIVAAFYFWIIGIGAEPKRFAWNSGLNQFYGLPGPAAPKSSSAVFEYYDLLARAFAKGQLRLPVEPQPELLALRDPWDDRTNEPFRLLDVVLYRRHYYLYHGATPALLLFVPWYLLTRHDFPENFATFLFALGGYFFLSILFLKILPFLTRRVPVILLTLCLLALGIAQSVPFLLHRALVYEVAIACGFCCLSAGFYFLFGWLINPRRRALWSFLAGLSLGLAVGCRPHFALAAACAAVFVVLLSDTSPRFLHRFMRKDVIAFFLPLIACGLAIAWYNYARFGNPMEFGTRFQLGVSSYQNFRLSIMNVAPGIYYLLLCPPDIVPEFPFFRLVMREPFDASAHVLPARYFLEPTGGLLALCPLVLLAVLTPLIRNRRIFALLALMLAVSASSIVFIATTGLTAQRFEVDFAPYLVFVACIVACELVGRLLRWPGRLALTAVIALLVYTLSVNIAFALQGPYDQFVQASPDTYVKLSKWFSPFERFRLLENPDLRIQASFDFASPCDPGWTPLITTGEFGSRYLLSADCSEKGRLKLNSEIAVFSSTKQSVDVAYHAGLNLLSLRFTPQDRIMTVAWNGNVVLRQPLGVLITAPSQIHFGSDPSTWGSKSTFPRRIFVFQQSILPGQSPSSH